MLSNTSAGVSLVKSKQTRVLSVKETAALMGVSIQTVHRLIDDGELDGYKKTEAPNSAYQLYFESVRDYIKRVQKRDIEK